MGPVLTFCADDKMDRPALGHGHSVNTRSQHNPQRKMHPAETPRRREPESLLSAPPPLCARFCSHSDFSPRSQSANPIHFVHSRFPSPTPTALCHTARGCADRRTPGPCHIASPTPSGVAPIPHRRPPKTPPQTCIPAIPI